MEVKKDLIGKKTPSVGEIAKKHGLKSNALRGEMAKGSEVEREHTKSGAEAKEIARDHLKEFPDYYTRLKKMEREADKAATVKKGNTKNMGEDVGRGTSSSDPDVLELLHRANAARIRKGAAEGKFWLLRSESVAEGVGMISGAFSSTKDRHTMQNMPRLFAPNKGQARKGTASGGQATSVRTGPVEPHEVEGVSGALGMGAMGEEERNELIKKIVETTMASAIGGRSMPFAGGGDFNQKTDGAFGARNKWPQPCGGTPVKLCATSSLGDIRRFELFIKCLLEDSMAKYRIIGKTKHLTSVYLLQDGKLNQHRILSGKTIDVDESELTFHVDRLVGKKDIQLVKLEEEPVVVTEPIQEPEPEREPEEVTEETPAVNIEESDDEPTPTTSKKRRGRKKKKIEDSEE